MKRQDAHSIEEICERHHCVARVGINDLLPVVEAYEDVVIIGDEGDVSFSLTVAIHAVRLEWEVVEVYVRPESWSIFEPLWIDSVGLHEPHREEPLPRQRQGTWVIVARRRHPTHGPRIVGIMMAKDEADVISDVVENLIFSLQNVFFIAGDSATREMILASSSSINGWAREVVIPDGLSSADGHRQFLLETARQAGESVGDRRPTWVMSVQGDEIYHDNIADHVRYADADRATVINCKVATFFLHESQREGWDWTQPLDRRLTHYVWDFSEHSGFLDFPWLHYDPTEHMRAHPHGIFPGIWLSSSKWPIRKHYPFRSPEQARARVEDRLKSGWQPHYENYKNVFMSGQAAGRDLRKREKDLSEEA